MTRPIPFVLAAALSLAPSALLANDIYLEAGRLIDVQAGNVLTGQCISITDDKITAIASCGLTPKGAESVDWSGFTVLPGLIDLHTHLAEDRNEDAYCAEMYRCRPVEHLESCGWMSDRTWVGM